LALYDEERHAHHRFVYIGPDPGVCAVSADAVFCTLLGYPAQATRREAEAVTLARSRGMHRRWRKHSIRFASPS
jgi:hypothetical protein